MTNRTLALPRAQPVLNSVTRGAANKRYGVGPAGTLGRRERNRWYIGYFGMVGDMNADASGNIARTALLRIKFVGGECQAPSFY